MEFLLGDSVDSREIYFSILKQVLANLTKASD